MKSKTTRGVLRFPLNLLHCGNHYYIERVAALELAVAKKPRQLQIDLVGEGEIPADWAMLIRSILNQRSAKTQIITNARSSLQNGSVLVWLLGDQRLIRDDARIFFRRANYTEESIGTQRAWDDDGLKYVDSNSEVDPEEADQAKVLQLINEFLPVKELVGRMIDVATLRQFGLVENEKLDRFLATAFGQPTEPNANASGKSSETKSKVPTTTSVQN
jgi:hypothetical protein